MGHTALDALPKLDAGHAKASLAALFTPGMAATTLLVTLAYFGHITTFYFILKWTPKIVADMGFAPGLTAGVLVWANVGGALGGALFGLLTLRYGLKPLTLVALFLSAIMVSVFGRGPSDLNQLALMAGAAGFFTERLELSVSIPSLHKFSQPSCAPAEPALPSALDAAGPHSRQSSRVCCFRQVMVCKLWLS